jgi:hypothetical protein
MDTTLAYEYSVEESSDKKGIDQLDDDSIWFHIFSCFGNDHGLIRHAKLTTFRPIDLFTSLSLVSKKFHDRLIRYMQVVPQNFYYREEKTCLLLWFCCHGVKLGSIDFYGRIHSETELSYFLWLLKRCNTGQLKSLKVNFHWKSPHKDFHVDKGLEDFSMCPDGITGSEDQRRLVCFLHDHACTISKLDILVSSDQLCLPFFFMRNLNGRKSALQHLSLNIRKGDNLVLESIYEAIANDNALRKLSLNIFSQQRTAVSHRIESLTLEEIDTRESAADFILDQCKCPSLKVFRGKCIPRKHWPDGWVGARAVSRITKAEIRNRIKSGDYVGFNGDFYGYHTLAYVVASRPFIGMNVPLSCVVLIDVLNYN